MNIEFISYDGKFPNLCSGELTLKIDGVIHKFWYKYIDDPNPPSWLKSADETHHDHFWSTGGSVEVIDDNWTFNVSTGAWELEKEHLPDSLKPYAQELIDIFNENVEYGCCGGCT